MTAALLFAAALALLSGCVRAAHIDSHLGKCHELLGQIAEFNEELAALLGHDRHKDGHKDGHKEGHNYKLEMRPECDEHGNFLPKQCHVFKYDDEWCQPDGECLHFKEGEKWCACVDVYSGMPDKSTLVQGGDYLYCDAEVKPQCPWGWMKFGEHGHEYCYAFIDAPKTWVEAERYCQWEKAHLASIDCPETDRFLQTLSRGFTHEFPPAWVGGTNAVKACFWMWTDGYFFKYEDFYMKENKERADSCLSINHKFKWSSKCCNETLPFICAKKPGYGDHEELAYDHHYEHH